MSDLVTETLRVLRFTHDDLRKLSEHEQVFLALLSYSISETNALWRIFNCAKQSTCGYKEVDGAVAIQMNVILRTWSAKLFELNQSLRNLTQEKHIDIGLSAFVLGMMKEISGSEDGDVSGVASRFRHNSTNHISIGSAKANLKRINQDADMNFYFSDREANSFFPLGEETFFAAEYNSVIKDRSEKTLDEFNDWLAWVIKTTKMLIGKLDEFFLEFVIVGDELLNWDRVSLNLPSELIGSSKDRRIPIFLQESDAQ